MPKKGQQGQAAASTAAGTGAGYSSAATGIGSTLVPELTKEATNPTGLTPTEQNSELVAGEQGAGGANAGIAGQAGLTAARTRNTGALSGVLDEAARAKTRQLSSNALGVANQNTALKTKEQQEGLAGLGSMYGTDVGAQLKSEGLVPEDINAEGPSTFQDVLGAVNSGAGLISAFKKPGGGGQGG
jgi:hypothetical protein